MPRERLLRFFAACYLAQGLGGVIFEPLLYLLKDGLGLDAAGSGAFVSAMTLPLLLKPLFGLAADSITQPGRRRLTAAAGLALNAAGLLALSALPLSYASLLGLLLVVNSGFVLADLACDALMVEHGRKLGETGMFQSVQIGVLYLSLAVTGLGGGWLSARASPSAVFALAAAAPLLALWSCLRLPEDPAAGAARRGLAGLAELARDRRAWAAAGLIFLWSFAPALGTAQFYFQTQELKLGPVLIGALSSLAGLAGVAGAAATHRASRRGLGLEPRLRWLLPVGAALALLQLACVGAASSIAVSIVVGGVGVFFRLALMELAASCCPEGAEAAAFAAFMSVFNLAAWSSNALGSAVYARIGGQNAWTALAALGALATVAAWPLLSAAQCTTRRPPR